MEKNIIAQSIRFGTPIPEKILNSPKVLPELQLYLEMFYELSYDRPVGMEVGPIPRSLILEYTAFYEFSEEMTFDALHLIRMMDAEYLKFIKKKDD